MSKQDLHDPVRSEGCHGGARKGAGRPKKVPLESGKVTRLRLFEETARKWRSLQSQTKFITHEEFASHLLQRYETDLIHSADVTQQIQVISSQLLDSLSKLEMQSNTGSKKRKPERTIHIAPCGSASLVKSSQKIQSIPKELHHSIQHVRTSLSSLNQEIELYVNSKKDLKINSQDVCDGSGDEEGILAIRTCKSREDRLPPIDTATDVHVVDILNPKTPQKLYYTNVFDNSNVNSEQDICNTDSSSSSSSEGFVPPNQSESKNSLPLTHLVDHQYTRSVNVEHEAVKPSDTDHQYTRSVNVEYEAVKPSDTVRSKSCSPPVVKVSGQQQRSLKEFSVKVVKLPQSVITSRNTNTVDPIHHGIHSAEQVSEGDLISNEITESSRAASDINRQDEVLPDEPITSNQLLCDESIVSCTEADTNICNNVQDEKDDLDHHSLSIMDCGDDHLQNVADCGTSKETHLPAFQKNCEAKSEKTISSPSYKDEDDERVNYQENFIKQHPSIIKNVNSDATNSDPANSNTTNSDPVNSDPVNSDTEYKGNVELEKALTTTSSSKRTIAKHKKVKSEEFVVSSCSETEAHIHSENSPRKKSIKRHKSVFKINADKSKISSQSGSEREEFSENVSLHGSVKSGAWQNSPQSNSCTIISSCSEHEQTKMHKRKKSPKVNRNKIPSSAVSTDKIMSSSSEHGFTPKRSHETDFSVSHKVKTEKPISVKRKLSMTEEVTTEGTDIKEPTAKYKLRSKVSSSMSKKCPCISCKGTVNLSYSYKVHKHPRFSAYMCEKCWKMYTNGKFTVDESDGHEEYCCVCGEGGEIVCCDHCHNSVCQDCIQRIGGKDYLDKLLQDSGDEEWKCFSCDTKFLRIYEQFYFQNSNMSKNCNKTADIPAELEEVEFSESFSSSDVSGIATDEVSMSDTELCINKEENNLHKSDYSSNTDTSTSKMPLCNISNNKRRKRAFADMFSDSGNSTDDMTEHHNKVTILSDDEQDLIQPIIHDAFDLPSPLHYAVGSGDERTSSSDSDLIAPKVSKSFRKTKLVSESSQKMSPNSTDNEGKTKVKWYSTRSKAYKGNELDSSVKNSSKKRKRRNVTLLSSESETDPDSSKPLTPSRKRRKLRKLIDDDKLEAETRRAQRDEELRLKRIKEKGKHSKGEENDKFILDSSGDIVDVQPTIASYLKPHQREGVKFLWDCCCENLERLNSSQGSGAILAHCMGLGKSLQVIAFVEALLRSESTNISKIAIIVPVNTLENWKNELLKWIPEDKLPRIYHLAMSNSLHGRLNELQEWFELGGILLCGYEMYRNLSSGKGKGFKSKTKLAVAEYLLDPGPDIVVCDEGHVLKNPKSALSQALNKLRTLRRIVLTGTPLQNNLMEYYTMVSFVKPKLLGTQKEFSNRFVNPIKNGQCRDSNEGDVRLMRYRSHVLHKLLKGCVQRHDYRVLTRELPPKQEYIILFRLSSLQESLYTTYLEKQVDHSRLGISGNLFTAYQTLFKIWNHPWILHLRDLRKKEEEELASGGSLKDFVVSGSDNECTSANKQGPSEDMSKQGHSSNFIVLSDSEEVEPTSEKQKTSDTKPCVEGTNVQWYGDIFTDDMETNLELSGKLVFLFDLLEETRCLDEKVLVFSQSLYTLDLIETFLQLPGLGDWCRGLDYLRIDGSTSAGCRSYCVDAFNSVDNPKTRLFLISTRAGSLGVNLTAANRVVIFDASWNPTNDLQAIFRTYRYGQTKPVFIYRLLSKGTMEEKIYERQVTKESLSLRVVDEKQIGRHFSQAELSELFEYSPAERRETPDPSLPTPKEDVILCKLLRKLHPVWIAGYHEHDSLLEHRFAEELTEEEQKKAWDNYEAKKTETVDYVARAVLMSQLHQQQNTMLASGASLDMPTTSTNGSNQPVAMPYMNQPQPPGTSQQGIDNVVQIAFQHCQELPTLHRNIAAISIELTKPNIANVAKDGLRESRKKKIEHATRSYKFLEQCVNLISTAIQSYTAIPSYQAKLAAAKQFIIDSIRTAKNVKV